MRKSLQEPLKFTFEDNLRNSDSEEDLEENPKNINNI